MLNELTIRKLIVFLFSFLFSGFCLLVSAYAACSGPSGSAGQMMYSHDYHVYQYCDGSVWHALGPQGASTGGSSCGPSDTYTGNGTDITGTDIVSSDVLNGLVAWYGLDEAAGCNQVYDYTGNGYTAYGDNPYYPTCGVAGKINKAVYFPGGSNYWFGTSDAAGLRLSGSWTVAGWVNLSSLPSSGNYMTLIDRDDSSGNNNYILFLDNGAASSGVGWGVGFATTTGSFHFAKYATTPSTGTWYHVAGVFDSSAHTLTLFLNGVQVAVSSVTGYSPTPNSGGGTRGLDLGSESNAGILNGDLDDMRLYNRALSAGEVSQLYNSTGTYLEGWWKFDDGAGTSAADSSATNDAGTLHGSPTWTSGKIGGALSFNPATADYVEVSDTANLRLSGSWSVSAWINPSALPGSGGYVVIADKENYVGGVESTNYFLGIDNNTTNYGSSGLGFVADYNSTGCCDDHYVKYTTSISTGTWYFLTAVYNASAGTETLYVNGAQVASSNVSGYPPEAGGGSDLFISAPSVPFSGVIDDLRVYGSALSAAQVSTIYNSQGLIGWWKLTDGSGANTADSSGNGNTGYLINTPTWITTGPSNNGGLTLNGTNRYVDVPETSTLNVSGSWTVSGWAKFSSTPTSGNYMSIMNKDDSNGQSNYNIGIDNGALSSGLGFYVTFNPTISGNYYAKYNTTVSTGVWYHIAGVYDATAQTITLYVNGAQAATASTGGVLPATDGGSDLEIGGEATFAALVNGSLDDLRVYNRALSASQIAQLYSAHSLVGWWKFDDGSGSSSAVDSSGNGNTGTLQNSPTWTTAGEIGGALSFNGTSQYVDVPETSLLNIAGSWTVSEWANFASTPTSGKFMQVLFKNDSSSLSNYNIGIDNGWVSSGLGFYVGFNISGGGFYYAKYNTTISTGIWYHIVAVYDASAQTLTLYVNGAQVATASVVGDVPLSDGGADLALGGNASHVYGVSGTLDDARIYSRAFSASDVAAPYTATSGLPGPEGQMLYNSSSHNYQFCNGTSWLAMGPKGAGGSGCSGTAVSSSNLVAWYKLDDSSGCNEALDSSPNGYWALGISGSYPTCGVTGKINTAAYFPGGSYYYFVTADSAGIRISGSWAVAGWVKLSSLPATNNAIVFMGRDDTGGNPNYISFLYNTSGTYYWYAGFDTSSGTDYYATYAATPSTGVWYHIAGVYDSSAHTMALYVNGVQENQISTAGASPTSNAGNSYQGIYLGSENNGGNLNGDLDDMRLYSRA